MNYNKLLQGGYNLDDESKNKYFKKILKDHQEKYIAQYDELFIDSYQNPDIKLDLLEMNTPDYLKVYDTLVDAYLNKETYTQKFINDKGDIISEIPDVFPSHINFAALIFLITRRL